MKQVLKKSLTKTKATIRKLPEKKQYIELVTALLSVPVLLTVILINYNNLKQKPAGSVATPTPQIVNRYIYPSSVSSDNQLSVATTPVIKECTADIPPISIGSPSEGQTVSDNPVTVQISYERKNYCSIVWSYRVNNGTWSDYDNASISLYNLPAGSVQLDLKVKSLASSSSTTLTRHFTYTGSSTIPSPTTDQNTGSSSAH